MSRSKKCGLCFIAGTAFFIFRPPLYSQSQDLTPPPQELRMEGKIEQTRTIYGIKCTFHQSWQARRTDYNWDSVADKYREFYLWYEDTKKKLEDDYAESQGRGRIQAARNLFEFALRADDKKRELDDQDIFCGTWEGDLEESGGATGASFFGNYESQKTLKLSITTVPFNRAAHGLFLAMRGEALQGAMQGSGKLIFGTTDILNKLRFSGLIEGQWDTDRSLIQFKIDPREVSGDAKVIANFGALGKMTVTQSFGKGTIESHGQWPEIEALYQYLEAFLGHPGSRLPLDTKASIREEAMIGNTFASGALNWTPAPLKDLKHEYFQRWFDAFWEVLGSEIGQAAELKTKADKAKELYESYVKNALAESQIYEIRKDVVDRCRLWAARAGSSIDESFETYFANEDAWLRQQIAEAEGLGAKRDRAKSQFDYSLKVTEDFQVGYLSEALQNKLKLWTQRAGSYIDRCFDQYFSFHKQYWIKEIMRQPTDKAKEGRSWDCYDEMPGFLKFADTGYLSQEIIDALELKAGVYDYYPDDCYRPGWNFGKTRFDRDFEKAASQSPAEQASLKQEYTAWLHKQYERAMAGYVSTKLAEEVDQALKKVGVT